MKISVSEKYNSVVLAFKGDLTGGEEIVEELGDVIKSNIDVGKKNFVVDLSDVKYVNSSGIGILVRYYTTIKNAEGEMKLADLPERVKGVLSITKLTQIFEIFPSVDEAAGSFK
ncbi:MAG: STAS domain-containing protein [Melioribacteraceae bacterium]|nr:STAS domain-containing protein [Melioribacteraceae bacterium]MCF8354454.1 STAS domain-containing protein [Melioribacteraceae bacterium]MCF8394064.1 STAS domain-containing protein [Melioribacteraceae bacterium]MCF8419830.1 STAS domain-containing protein [Melioribacteraceae bacterium]